ncbi:transcription antitermination factor NusB [Rhabdobacter roseus]|uniref:Transcription antitermination protein NusB n=1 Tax=Rhabdobacter roseus TaxID=1655419 RepID=A0A840TYW7_9BACT|nr:transcription antitermination factor NusB [Rhabdobacter roseus]MBB5286493.1 N utilization substance protein B [Rhabdobacter roseus]
MLNRRLLRTKAVQALYASQLATDSNRMLAMDEIAEAYLPDLNSMEPQNRPKLEGMKRLATLTLDELIKTGKPSEDEEVPFEVIQTARQAFEGYQKSTKADRQQMVRRVLQETEAIYDEFLLVMQLLVELAHQSQIERERAFQDLEFEMPRESGLDTNSVLRQLREHHDFQVEVIRRGISWSNDMSLVRKTFRDVVRKDETYQAYCRQNVHTAEEDQEMAQHVLRRIVLKHEVPVEFFEQRDLYWADHSELIRSLAIKTLKSAEKGATMQLPALTEDWEEDKFFVEELFRQTIENDEQYETYLIDQLKNWDLERIALVDMVIMKTALAELIHFPGIPVKVTINEFIEIAKRYSTPKSGKFVNGVLDVLAEKLKAQGVIRKSGRGLIDNK